MTSLFDDISQFDDRFAAARREAAAVAHKRVQDTVGGYLRLAKTAEEWDARLSYVSDDIRTIVADTASEFDVDQDKLLDAIAENLKGDGVTDLNMDLMDAPSAVGTGEKTAGGHKDGCTCGFCKNKGNIGKPKEHDKETHEGDESESADDDGGSSVEASTHVAWDPNGPEVGMQHDFGGEIYVRTSSGELIGPYQNEEEALREKAAAEAEEQQPGGAMPPGHMASTHVADAPRDGGGATKTVKLPKGDGKSIGDGASPKIDKKQWKPNALNADGNLPAVPEGIEMDGSPVPTERQDLVDEERDYSRDFEDKIDAATTTQDLPAANDTGMSTERNISQDSQMGQWTEAQGDAVTPKVFASFVPNDQVESAIAEFDSKE